MKRLLLRSISEKGTIGLKKLKPNKRGIKTRVYLENPYTLELRLTNKRFQKVLTEKDIESFLYMYPHLVGCSLRKYKDYEMEVLE